MAITGIESGHQTVTGLPSVSLSGLSAVASGSTEARTLAERFADTINVKDYGAVGDGTTDDTTAIQAAITAGVSVFIPPGEYVVAPASVYIPSGRTVFGGGMGVTTLHVKAGSYSADGDGSAPALLNVSGSISDVIIRDLTIDGNKSNVTGTVGVHGIKVKGTSLAVKASKIEINSVEIANCKFGSTAFGYGALLWYVDLTKVTGCKIHGNDGDGLDVYYGSTRVNVEGNQFWDNVYFAVESEGRNGSDWSGYRNSNVTISNNSISNSQAGGIGFIATDVFVASGNTVATGGASGNRRGIQVVGCTGGAVKANSVDSFAGAGIWVGNDYSSYPTTYGSIASNRSVTVEGNSVSACGIGINLWQDGAGGANDAVVVSGNVIRSSTTYGIQVDGGVNRVRVAGNSIFAGTTGIVVAEGGASSGPVVLDSNTIDTPSAYGISISGQVGAKVTGNVIRSPTDVGILFGATATSLTDVEVSRNTVSGTGATRSIDATAAHTSLYFFDNVTDKPLALVPTASDKLRNNNGYVSAASGVTASIADNTTVSHGLGNSLAGDTPVVVTLTAADGTPTAVYPSTLGTSTFTIRYAGGGTHAFYWTARIAQDQ